MDVIKQLSDEFNLDQEIVKKTVTLFDKDNSLHFIARYRRDQTGGMESDTLREFEKRLSFLRSLEEEKAKSLAYLKENDQLTKQLESAILSSDTISDIKEIMSPYRSKRKTRASKARDKGLQPVANIILGNESGDIESKLEQFDDKDEALQMSLDIVAEESINHPDCKKIVETEIKKKPVTIRYREEKDENGVYKNLLEISENQPVAKLQPHQIHALFRAEEEGVVTFSFNSDLDRLLPDIAKASGFHPIGKNKEYFNKGLEDGVNRLLKGRAERSVKSKLKELADERAIEVFKQNLFDLLTQPPIEPKIILGIDPGYRSGCKVAVIDKEHNLLSSHTIYPTPPKEDYAKSAQIVSDLIEQFGVDFIAIGNGTGSNETADFIKKMLKEHKLAKINWAVIPETGASVYSASKIAEEEFPDLSAPARGAISIARRVLDPLAEYVKIDPKSLGVGQYQHSIDSSALEEALDYIVDKAVNTIGINIQTASKTLLEHVSGLSASTAEAIIEARNAGKIFERDDLLKVKGIGMVTFEQAVGFLKFYNSDNPLDQTMIHPDHYTIAKSLIEETDMNIYTWKGISKGKRRNLLNNIKINNYTTDHVGEITIKDIIDELITYGEDPRGRKEFMDRSNQPEDIEALKEGMILNGEVSNVVDFGAFVDLGIKENGLIHISNLADRFVSNVRSVVKIGDPVKVEVVNLDLNRKRIALRLIEVDGQVP